MALIKCPDCKSRVSENATNCPKCGCPKDKFIITVKEKRKTTLLDVFWIALLLGGFYLFTRGSMINTSGQQELPKERKATLQAGSGSILLADTKEDYDQATDAIFKKDNYGLEELLTSGKVFEVKTNTSVLVLGNTLTTREVRILDGPDAGKAGWCAVEFVSKNN